MNITCPYCGVSYDPAQPQNVLDCWGATKQAALEHAHRQLKSLSAHADRALRDKLAMALFQAEVMRHEIAATGYYPKDSAQWALEYADIFMAERAKRDKDRD